MKPQNCLVLGSVLNPCVKLCDFGTAYYQQVTQSTQQSTSLTQLKGTPLYQSPEAFDEEVESTTKENDIYSFALTFISILYPNQSTPYGDKLKKYTFTKLLKLMFLGCLWRFKDVGKYCIECHCEVDNP